ncbi:uncharacterized protein LOC124683301 isoform X2 [Lolium rigidum]|uniref:uncharacterized protein LOC124683301 isoform X2 n=1 Tax=Lolium rigidum TaxID=89674 RepID=UPI001F5E0AC2|nr:uncharacterized protein LOC124683301 isoform X2 [Lolium rigidum]
MEVEKWAGGCLILGKAGVEFLNGVGKGVETHIAELEEAGRVIFNGIRGRREVYSRLFLLRSMAAAPMRLKLCDGTGARVVGDNDAAPVAATPPMSYDGGWLEGSSSLKNVPNHRHKVQSKHANAEA